MMGAEGNAPAQRCARFHHMETEWSPDALEAGNRRSDPREAATNYADAECRVAHNSRQ